MLGAEVEPEALVQLGDDARKGFELLQRGPVSPFGAGRVEYAGLALEGDLAASRLLDPVRLHVDVLLHLARQLGAVGGEQPPQVAREDV